MSRQTWQPISRDEYRALYDSGTPEIRATYTRNAPGDEFGTGDYWLTEWRLSDGRVIRSINNNGAWNYAVREKGGEDDE